MVGVGRRRATGVVTWLGAVLFALLAVYGMPFGQGRAEAANVLVNGDYPIPCSYTQAASQVNRYTLTDVTFSRGSSGFFEYQSPTCDALRRMQDAAADDVISMRGLPNDRAYAMRYAQNEVRGATWIRILAAGKKKPADRTADESLVVAYFESVLKKFNVEVAQQARSEYSSFINYGPSGPGYCSYLPPAPYESEYPGEGKTRESICYNPRDITFLGPDVPSFDSFQKWGTARVMTGLVDQRTAQIATETAAAIGVISTAATVGIVGTGVAIALAGAGTFYTLTIGTTGLITGATITYGAAALATLAVGVVAIVLAAIVIAVFAGIKVFSPRPDAQLNQAVTDAQASTVALSRVIEDTNQVGQLYWLFADLASQQGDPVLGVPALVATDPNFTAWPVGQPKPATAAPTFVVQDWDGTQQTVSMRGGLFLVNGASPSTSFRFLGTDGSKRRAWRQSIGGGNFVFLSTAENVDISKCVDATYTLCTTGPRLSVRTANGAAGNLEMAYTGPPLITLTSTTTEVTELNSLTLSATARDATGASVPVSWSIGDECPQDKYAGFGLPCHDPYLNPVTDPDPAGNQYSDPVTDATFTFFSQEPGTRYVRITASDAAGRTATRVVPINVVDTPFGLTVNPAKGSSDCKPTTTCDNRYRLSSGTIEFSGVVDTTSPYTPALLGVDWGDGTTTQARLPTSVICPASGCGDPFITQTDLGGNRFGFRAFRTFATPVGTRQATLTVSWPGHQTVVKRFTYNVAGAPTITGSGSTTATEGDTLQFSASGSDYDGRALTVSWSTTDQCLFSPSQGICISPNPLADRDPSGGLYVSAGTGPTTSVTFHRAGTYYVRARVTDSAGVKVDKVFAVVVADIPPTLTVNPGSFSPDCLTAPVCDQRWALITKPITVSGRIDGQSIYELQTLEVTWNDGTVDTYYVPELAWVPTPGLTVTDLGGGDYTFSVSRSFSSRTPGPVTGSVKVTDAGGASSSVESFTYQVDPVPGPSISDVVVPRYSNSTSTVPVSAMIESASATTVAGAKVWIDTIAGDGQSMTGPSGSSSATFMADVDVSGLTEGLHTVWVQPIDALGQTGDPVARGLTIDRTRPTIAPTLTPAILTVGQDGVLRANGTDAGSGIDREVCDPIYNSYAGFYYANCTVWDRAGNNSSESIKVQTVPAPDVVVTVTAPPTVAKGQKFTVGVSASNVGRGPAFNDVVVVTFDPSVVRLVNAAGGVVNGGTITFTKSVIRPGRGFFWGPTFVSRTKGSFDFTASLTTTSLDPDLSDNTARAVTRI